LNYINVVSGGSTSSPPPTIVPTPTGTGVTSASVVTWNVQVDDSSAYHAAVAMDYIMNMSPRPQIIVIEEAHQSQFNTYLSELQNQTGQTWHGVMQTHCPLGAWNGSWCTSSEDEGVAILSPFSIISSDKSYLPYADCWHSARAIARAALNVNGVTVQVFGTHLQTGSCGINVQQQRYNSMSWLKSWASGFSTPQVVAGDFNADPNQIDTAQGMNGSFVEAWSLVGSGLGYTAFTPNPSMHIDYWFSDASLKAMPQSIEVVTTAGTFSDHCPVRATYAFNP
jgi:endonuclease/exonuclease/phosphatase family metal-dependent hydrolase